MEGLHCRVLLTLGKEFHCRVPVKKHPAKNETHGKDTISGSEIYVLSLKTDFFIYVKRQKLSLWKAYF
jgi:hypothetical protein